MKSPALHGFLNEMAIQSAQRAALLQPRKDELCERAEAQAPPLRPRLSGFDVIAEIKLNSPSEGVLCVADDSKLAVRVSSYAKAGAAAISVLTEPTRFGGSLDHLRLATTCAHEYGVAVMRKDFPVSPLQLVEARAHGADGVLVIARIVSDAGLISLVETAQALGLFVLLEAFDSIDLKRIKALIPGQTDALSNALVGVNARDLTTLQVDTNRQLALARVLPRELGCVAESGILTPEDAGRAAGAGYGLVLVGTALMRASDPRGLLADFLAAGRSAQIDCNPRGVLQ